MIKRKKAIFAYLFLMVMTLCAACGRNTSDADRSVAAEGTREGGTTSQPVVYTAGEDMCAMYSGAGYTISGSEEFILGGQSSVYGDEFAFLAYQHDEKTDKYEAVIGKIDYSGIASMENEGEQGFIYSLQTFGADGSMKGKADIEYEDGVCGDCERIANFGGGGTEYTALLAIDGKKA